MLKVAAVNWPLAMITGITITNTGSKTMRFTYSGGASGARDLQPGKSFTFASKKLIWDAIQVVITPANGVKTTFSLKNGGKAFGQGTYKVSAAVVAFTIDSLFNNDFVEALRQSWGTGNLIKNAKTILGNRVVDWAWRFFPEQSAQYFSQGELRKLNENCVNHAMCQSAYHCSSKKCTAKQEKFEPCTPGKTVCVDGSKCQFDPNAGEEMCL